MQTAAQSILDLPGVKKLRSGKVREVFDLGDTLLFVATDRISAFDVILPDPIPKKGAVLNQLSAFWFNRFGLWEAGQILGSSLELEEVGRRLLAIAGRVSGLEAGVLSLRDSQGRLRVWQTVGPERYWQDLR